MIEAVAKKRPDGRVVYEYTLPEELVGLGDEYIRSSFGLCKLRMSQEIKASDAAGKSQTRLAYNWAMAALTEVDGRRVQREEGEEETIMENTDPAIREALLAAYTDMASASGDAVKKLLGSRKIKTT